MKLFLVSESAKCHGCGSDDCKLSCFAASQAKADKLYAQGLTGLCEDCLKSLRWLIRRAGWPKAFAPNGSGGRHENL